MLTTSILKKAELWRHAVDPTRKHAYQLLLKASHLSGVDSQEAARLREIISLLDEIELKLCTLTAEKLNGQGVIELDKALSKGDDVLAEFAAAAQRK